MKKRCMAIVLSAGQGKRMGTSIQKQYIELCGKPIICYCLEAFEKSEIIDDVIMVVGSEFRRSISFLHRTSHLVVRATDFSIYSLSATLDGHSSNAIAIVDARFD